MADKPNKRIAINPDIYKALWQIAGQRGKRVHEIADEILRNGLSVYLVHPEVLKEEDKPDEDPMSDKEYARFIG